MNPAERAGPDEHSMLDRVVAEVERRGLTGEGADYVVKALYPPWNRTGVYMPGEDTRPSIVFDTRETRTIGRGPACPATSNWDCMIIVNSNELNPVMVVRGEAGVDFGANAKPATAENSPEYIATAVGINVVACSFRNASGALVTATTGWPRPIPISCRNTSRSLTVHLAASSLNNGGTVTVGQLPGTSVAGGGIGWDSAPTTYPTTGSNFWAPANHVVPPDEPALSVLCPAVYAGPAREGMFAINRIYPDYDGRCSGSDYRGRIAATSGASLSTGLVSFDAQPDNYTEGSAWPFLPFRPLYSTCSATSVTTLPWWSLGLKLDGSYPVGLIGDSDSTTTVAFFRGLAPEATLQLNLFSSVQMALHPGSQYAPLAKRPPRADPRALDAYSVLSAKLDDAYPARCNSLALLAPFLLQAVKSILPMVTKAVPGVARYTGMIAPVAEAVARTFRDGERAGEEKVLRPSRPRPARPATKSKTAKPRPKSKVQPKRK